DENLPVRVELVEWSHGFGRFLADHLHWRNVEVQGQHLAAQVQACRARDPNQPVSLLGHSAGCAVCLVAAEHLPQDSLDRVVLLPASVSSDYDLRRPLNAAHQGIDVFYSNRDWFVLGLGTTFSGTTDRRLSAAAGRVGFRAEGTSPQDRELYAKLR